MPAPAALPDFAHARALMVDGQLRPSKVTDRRVLDAMRALPRELFLPAALRHLAYIDADVALGGGRVLLRPLVTARLIQLAQPRAGETALVVGAGALYGAAILAACGVEVTALEERADLRDLAAAAQRATGHGAALAAGRLEDGWPEAAPYDIVLIEGAVRAIPERIGRQVCDAGRLVTVLAPEGGTAVAVIAEPSTHGLAVRPAFDAAAPLLPELLPAPAFVF